MPKARYVVQFTPIARPSVDIVKRGLCLIRLSILCALISSCKSWNSRLQSVAEAYPGLTTATPKTPNNQALLVNRHPLWKTLADITANQQYQALLTYPPPKSIMSTTAVKTPAPALSFIGWFQDRSRNCTPYNSSLRGCLICLRKISECIVSE